MSSRDITNPPRSPGAPPRRAPRGPERCFDAGRGVCIDRPADDDWQPPTEGDLYAVRPLVSWWERVMASKR